MTHKLYHSDAYSKTFSAQVVAVADGEIVLNRTAFYPTGGGQPCDLGRLNGCAVSDVNIGTDGVIRHMVDGRFAVGDDVVGEIDWARRFDHMQQHAGEHLLSWAINQQLGGTVIGLHIGHDFSTVDARLPGQCAITPDQIHALETAVQRIIERDVPIRSWYPSPEEYAQLPLRKPTSVETDVRVVAIGEDEFVPCGGTHPSSSGQIALFKLMHCRPNRGLMRFFFMCGMRAYRDYQGACVQRDALSELLSKPASELVPAVNHLFERVRSLEYAAHTAQIARAKNCSARAINAKADIGGLPTIIFREDDLSADALNTLLTDILERETTRALLLSFDGQRTQVVFGCASTIGHMGDLMRAFMATCGGSGGGREHYARGSAPGEISLHQLEAFIRS